MSLASKLKDRVQIQLRNVVQTATGETVIWTPVEKRYCRVVPLDAQARAAFQQLQSHVTHRVIFRGEVTITLGDHRLLWGSKTLEPVEAVQVLDNGTSTVAVKEA